MENGNDRVPEIKRDSLSEERRLVVEVLKKRWPISPGVLISACWTLKYPAPRSRPSIYQKVNCCSFPYILFVCQEVKRTEISRLSTTSVVLFPNIFSSKPSLASSTSSKTISPITFPGTKNRPFSRVRSPPWGHWEFINLIVIFKCGEIWFLYSCVESSESGVDAGRGAMVGAAKNRSYCLGLTGTTWLDGLVRAWSIRDN